MPALPTGTNAMTLLEQLVKRGLPLDYIKAWSDHSFKFDAISILSILGSDEVDMAVGSLIRRRYTEWLPLLAGQVIASNRFAGKLSGFTIYNIDDGITTTTDINGWFTRWVMNQSTDRSTTVLKWQPRGEHTRLACLISPICSFILIAPLLICTTLMGDWYGVCNSVAIIASILCRLSLLVQLRHDSMRDELVASNCTKRVLIVRPDGIMITCIMPNSVLGLATRPVLIKHRSYHRSIRRLAWLALGIHLCTLNLSTLFSQIYTLLLLGLSTWTMSSNLNYDRGSTLINKKGDGDFSESIWRQPFSADWDVLVTYHPRKRPDTSGHIERMDRRLVAWARLGLNDAQEEKMRHWDLMPSADNKCWWEDYHNLKTELSVASPGRRLPTSTAPPAPMGPRPPYLDTSSSPPVSIPLTELSRSPANTLNHADIRASPNTLERSGTPARADNR